MVECARLEIAYTGNRIKGSNPFVSARNYTASRYFLLNYQPFYDIIVRNNRTPTRPYFLSRPRDFFIYQKETNTYGRDGFTIHGGLFPGSAGCIDLTGQISMFISWLESTGKDLVVYVEY